MTVRNYKNKYDTFLRLNKIVGSHGFATTETRSNRHICNDIRTRAKKITEDSIRTIKYDFKYVFYVINIVEQTEFIFNKTIIVLILLD